MVDGCLVGLTGWMDGWMDGRSDAFSEGKEFDTLPWLTMMVVVVSRCAGSERCHFF